jgi:branched-chain amino acid transport system substrate-binding protein
MYPSGADIARQIQQLGIVTKILGTDGWDSESFAEIGGGAVEGVYFTTHFHRSEPRKVVADFVRAYRREHGEDPGSLAALGYDAAAILIAAMKRAPTLDGVDIANAIAETSNHEGVSGTINLDSDRNPTTSWLVVQMRNGQPVFASRIAP